MEGTHEQLSVIAQSCTDFSTGTGGGQAIRAAFHQVLSAGNVASGRSNAAARILNERACHQVSAVGSWLVPLHKLAVAVIHHNDTIRRNALGDFRNPLNVLHKEGGAQAVSSGTLDVDHLHVRANGGFHGFIVRCAIGLQI